MSVWHWFYILRKWDVNKDRVNELYLINFINVLDFIIVILHALDDLLGVDTVLFLQILFTWIYLI